MKTNSSNLATFAEDCATTWREANGGDFPISLTPDHYAYETNPNWAEERYRDAYGEAGMMFAHLPRDEVPDADADDVIGAFADALIAYDADHFEA